MSAMRSVWRTLALMALLAACSSPTPEALDLAESVFSAGPAGGQVTPVDSVTQEGLIGAWRQDGTGYCVQFGADGTFRMADSEGELETSRFGRGEFRLEGDLLILASADGANLCPGLTGRYRVEWTELRQLRLRLVEDPCGDRAATAPSAALIRVSP